jgi:hypothetical protein
VNKYPRGSEWRKWDLHVHVPGTKLSNGYGQPDWDRFCQILEESDVDAFGITDYFSLEGFFVCRDEYERRYPGSHKVLFPNLELRLNESVNRHNESVNLHVILRPDLTVADGARLLNELKTELLGEGDRRLSCADLKSRDDYEQATVTRERVTIAINAAFGSGVPRDEHLITVVPARGDGIRTARGERRKAVLTDLIDGLTDAVFGRASDQPHFLKTDRYEDKEKVSTPKPVFSGSDAHSFEQLETLLGRTVDVGDNHNATTWVKADLTFEGLQQTLVEPSERVRIQPGIPDAKEPYKVISRVNFRGTDDFPAEVLLNQNLVSVIGSRSSGKSALLAYIAHAVDPDYTMGQQLAARNGLNTDDLGPAAGKTWDEVAHIECSVEWADAHATTGRVIYIPQNSLFSISERPEEVAKKIQPALYRISNDFQIAHERALAVVEAESGNIADAVAAWMSHRDAVVAAKTRLQDYGDKKAVVAIRDELARDIQELRAASSLTEEEIAAYEKAEFELRSIARESEAVRAESELLSTYELSAAAPKGSDRLRTAIAVDIRTVPAPDDLEEALRKQVQGLTEAARAELVAAITEALSERLAWLTRRSEELEERRSALEEQHSALFTKHRALGEVEALVVRHAAQLETLVRIDREESSVAEHMAGQTAAVTEVEAALVARAKASDELKAAFAQHGATVDGMQFGFEEAIPDEALERVSERFNRRERGRFMQRESRQIDIDSVTTTPAVFLESLATGEQRLKDVTKPEDAAVAVLTMAPEIRFFAVLEGDRIGGFKRSSMTPGKQALFALTLTLSESDEPWPLLIDQPEDDLDSRSIYETIVPYLEARKRERQILMVTHDANLAIGADSEQLVVANRHGHDRRNENDRMFDYATGSLEHTRAKDEEEGIVLASCGIREHACEVLDGGAEAFQKRRDKYRI